MLVSRRRTRSVRAGKPGGCPVRQPPSLAHLSSGRWPRPHGGSPHVRFRPPGCANAWEDARTREAPFPDEWPRQCEKISAAWRADRPAARRCDAPSPDEAEGVTRRERPGPGTASAPGPKTRFARTGARAPWPPFPFHPAPRLSFLASMQERLSDDVPVARARWQSERKLASGRQIAGFPPGASGAGRANRQPAAASSRSASAAASAAGRPPVRSSAMRARSRSTARR